MKGTQNIMEKIKRVSFAADRVFSKSLRMIPKDFGDFWRINIYCFFFCGIVFQKYGQREGYDPNISRLSQTLILDMYESDELWNP